MGITALADGNEVTLGTQVLFWLTYGIIAMTVAEFMNRRLAEYQEKGESYYD